MSNNMINKIDKKISDYENKLFECLQRLETTSDEVRVNELKKTISECEEKIELLKKTKLEFAGSIIEETQNSERNSEDSTAINEFEKIKKYKELYEEGIITEAEFVAVKAKLMGIQVDEKGEEPLEEESVEQEADEIPSFSERIRNYIDRKIGNQEDEKYGYSDEDIITLEYDNGSEEECGIIGVFDVDGKDYIALNPLGTREVYIYGYKEYEDDFELIDDLTDEEFEKATKEFESLIETGIEYELIER